VHLLSLPSFNAGEPEQKTINNAFDDFLEVAKSESEKEEIKNFKAIVMDTLKRNSGTEGKKEEVSKGNVLEKKEKPKEVQAKPITEVKKYVSVLNKEQIAKLLHYIERQKDNDAKRFLQIHISQALSSNPNKDPKAEIEKIFKDLFQSLGNGNNTLHKDERIKKFKDKVMKALEGKSEESKDVRVLKAEDKEYLEKSELLNQFGKTNNENGSAIKELIDAVEKLIDNPEKNLGREQTNEINDAFDGLLKYLDKKWQDSGAVSKKGQEIAQEAVKIEKLRNTVMDTLVRNITVAETGGKWKNRIV